jgi:hypothetical protein
VAAVPLGSSDLVGVKRVLMLLESKPRFWFLVFEVSQSTASTAIQKHVFMLVALISSSYDQEQ